MGFVASEHAAPLDYDFGGNAKGTIPEPSSKEVNKFFDKLSHAVEQVTGEKIEGRDPLTLSRVVSKMTTEQADALVDSQINAICELTKNHPTKGQLEKAGHRVRVAFLGWLIGELRNPEGPRPATNI